jgi:23S rRNA (cytosine1962-C5)-methyltransferase
VAIDGSASACAGIARTAALNGVPVEVIESNAREAMARLPERSFDLVSVDPPAFAKTRKLASKALGAYKAVNAAGARLVAPGGLLFASSCSHHVFRERWEEAVAAGIRAAGRRGVLVHRGGQAPDHPILPGVPETDYLKHGVWALD